MSKEQDLSVWIDDTNTPTVNTIMKSESIDRKKARDLVASITRERELDTEAVLPSGDEHLDKLINKPIIAAIKAIENQNENLLEIIETGNCTSDITPFDASKLFSENTKTLLEIKRSLSKPKDGSTNISIDMGDIFGRAKKAAQEAIDLEEVTINAIKDKA